ncbi:MAG: response regulator [Spirochaetota bacterium]
MADADEARRPIALVVEDNQVNRMVACQMLKRGGIDTIEADGGKAALERLQEQSVDLVLMDVQMPDMDGLEAARAIRAGRAGDDRAMVPIVAMTAYASEEDVQACYDAGMDAYLSKPLNMERFLDTVRTVIETRRKSSRAPGA